MLFRDTEISRQFAHERHAELMHDRRSAAVHAAAPPSRSRRSPLAWMRTHLRSAGHAPAGHAS